MKFTWSDQKSIILTRAVVAGAIAGCGIMTVSGPWLTRWMVSAHALPPVPSVPGNRPYRLFRPSPLPQTVDNNHCVRCGLCAQKCPTRAIDENDPAMVNPWRCISCMRCVNICPHGARRADEAMIRAVTEKLAPLCPERRGNSFFPA